MSVGTNVLRVDTWDKVTGTAQYTGDLEPRDCLAPGLIRTAVEIVGTGKRYDRDELKKLISGHLCRCTGCENILNDMERIVEETWNRHRI